MDLSRLVLMCFRLDSPPLFAEPTDPPLAPSQTPAACLPRPLSTTLPASSAKIPSPAIGLSLFYSPARLVLSHYRTDIVLILYCPFYACATFLPSRAGKCFYRVVSKGVGVRSKPLTDPAFRTGEDVFLGSTVQVHHTLPYITAHTTSIRTTTHTTISISTATISY